MDIDEVLACLAFLLEDRLHLDLRLVPARNMYFQKSNVIFGTQIGSLFAAFLARIDSSRPLATPTDATSRHAGSCSANT
jgi:hypothetical protein